MPIQNSLGMKNLRITTLLRQSSEELKHEVFLRLNTGGEILNPQEIRNVAYRGPLNDLIYTLAENDFLRKQFKVIPKTSPAYRQMTDAEMVLRFFALSAGWQTFKGGLREELDRFMLKNRFEDDNFLAQHERLFLRTVEGVEAIWGDHAYKRPGRDMAIAGMYDAQMVALSILNEGDMTVAIGKRRELTKRVEKLFDEEEFDEAVRRATNTPTRLRYRINRLGQVLSEIVT